LDELHQRKKKVVLEEPEEQEEIEAQSADFQDGLCMKFLGKFAKKLQFNEKNSEELEKLDYICFELNPKFIFFHKKARMTFLRMWIDHHMKPKFAD